MNQALITDYTFILTDENEIPFIEGTSMKVVELVTSIHSWHWFSPIIRMKSLQDKDLTENTKLKKLFPS